MKVQNLTGKRFGMLIVTERAENVVTSGGNSLVAWKCRCDCGRETVVPAGRLRNGITKSCGCQKHKSGKEHWNYKHGECGTRIYKIWEGIKKRCYTPSFKDYAIYGGKGIKMCNEWTGENGYENFREWALSHGYDEKANSSDCTIDRIDVNGDYSPENCRWVNATQQANNRTTSRYITYHGETHTIAEWARILNVPYGRIQSRLYLGWSPEEIIETGKLKANRKFATASLTEEREREVI